ncbi:hypothetical protein [Cellulomonas composti]|uniref:Asp23/Gls24 family envelope stress response protein n=1 Tax=Cellulomonas composti TaxID=266130 RepID=A0A511JA28_9CELL|nr:hypothetical protein [Cellulomonas composti]GEL94834.1 hypothetical protein CCO02nite_14920 [Cellulomonas composti]
MTDPGVAPLRGALDPPRDPSLGPPLGTAPTEPLIVVGPEPRDPAEEVAAAVLAVPGVVRLHGGRFGGLGTYLPGRRVTGVRIDEAGTEVHVVVSGVAPVPVTVGRVQRAVSAIAPMPVHVHVEDIDVS